MYKSEQFTPTEGMTIWALPGGNASRYWDHEPIEVKVVAVKRKYFYVRPKDSAWQTWKFFLEDNTFYDEADSNNTYAVYTTKDAADKAVQCEREFKAIMNHLSNARGDEIQTLGYEKVHAVFEILGLTSAQF